MARGKTAEKAEIIKRQILALDLKLSGWSYRKIGEKLNISHVQAFDDVKNAIAELNSQKLEVTGDYVAIELERLDMLTKGLEPMAAVGNPIAVNAYVKVMDQRAKLLGLYAPAKTDITSGGQPLSWADVVRQAREDNGELDEDQVE